MSETSIPLEHDEVEKSGMLDIHAGNYGVDATCVVVINLRNRDAVRGRQRQYKFECKASKVSSRRVGTRTVLMSSGRLYIATDMGLQSLKSR